MSRLSPYSQKFKPQNVDGLIFLAPVFDDLDDGQLLDQLQHFLETEDYEYCDFLAAECNFRNINIQHLLNQ